MRPFEAALKGAREIGFTIVSITFSLIAVFIPVLLMGGIVGRVFREFAVTIAVAIVAVGLRLADADADAVRARAARPSRGRARRSRSSCCACSSASSTAGCKAYEWALDRVLAYKSIMLVVTFATIVGTVWLYIAIPKGFFPQRRHRLHAGDHRGAVGHFVRRHGRAPAQGRRDHPRTTRRCSTSIRRSASAAPIPRSTTGRMLVALKPKHERGPLERGHSAACAASTSARHRHDRVLPDDPEHQRRRPDQQEPVPVHAAIERYRDALQARAGTARQDLPRSTACST